MTIEIKGTLEVDLNRGVIYFHTNQPVYSKRGRVGNLTLLRISKLKFPKGFDPKLDQLDITIKPEVAVSYCG